MAFLRDMGGNSVAEMRETPTIAAISTPAGSGGIGIVRISGTNATKIMARMFSFSSLPEGSTLCEVESHKLYLGEVTDPRKGIVLDQGLAVLMRAPHSYTAEDVVEFQCHGGPLLLNCVLEAVLGCGAVPAQPGEFSMRAFMNGRMDLTQAEAVMDLVSAKTPQALVNSAGQLTGALARRFFEIEEQILNLLAEIEVGVDFPEDEDAPAAVDVLPKLDVLLKMTEALLSGADLGRIYCEGLRVSLIGAVNVGKSSLMNALLQEDRVIVTEIPGTTRDTVEEWLDVCGIPVLLSDTAGLREPADMIEKMGIVRSREIAERAHLRLLVLDAAGGLFPAEKVLVQEYASKKCLLVINKCDLAVPASLLEEIGVMVPDSRVVCVSARSGEGLRELKEAIKTIALGGGREDSCEVLLSNLRQKNALMRARESVLEAEKALREGLPVDVAAVDLMSAYSCLGEITGKTAGEEVIERIFASFCLGK